MKLKLETIPPTAANTPAGLEVIVLVVTEGIESASFPILKAGLNKLIVSGKRNILLDCSSLKAADVKDASLLPLISDLRGWAAGLEGHTGAQVLVVSTIEQMAHVHTREEGIALLGSGTAPLLALEAKLQNDIKALQAQKTSLEAKINQAGSAGDPKALLKESSDLKKSIADTDRLIRRFLKNRSKDPFQVPATEVLQDGLSQMLDAVLKSEGILV